MLVSYCCCNKLHTCSGLKQYSFSILEFWRSEVQKGSQWANIKVSAGLCSCWRFWQRIHFLPFPASRACLDSLAHGPFLHLQSQQCNIFKSAFEFDFTLCLPLPYFKSPCDSIVISKILVITTWIIYHHLPMSRS